jgi:hypothetical protein
VTAAPVVEIDEAACGECGQGTAVAMLPVLGLLLGMKLQSRRRVTRGVGHGSRWKSN